MDRPQIAALADRLEAATDLLYPGTSDEFDDDLLQAASILHRLANGEVA
jgi:hypothetical protein